MQYAIKCCKLFHALKTQVLPAVTNAVKAAATASCRQGCSTPTSMSALTLAALTLQLVYCSPTSSLRSHLLLQQLSLQTTLVSEGHEELATLDCILHVACSNGIANGPEQRREALAGTCMQQRH